MTPTPQPSLSASPSGAGPVSGRFVVFAAGCLLAATACFSLFPFSGQAVQKETNARIVQELNPTAWKLSPEAEHLYYYLLLSDALAGNSPLVVAHALKGLLKLDPSLPVFQDSTTILLSRGEFEAAEQTAAEGLKHFPDDTDLLLLLAGAYTETGKAGKAISMLEEHRKRKPDAARLREALVRLYLNEGMDKKASDLLASIPEAEQSTESELFRAGVLTSVGRYTEAKELLHKLLQADAELYEAWLELAFIYEREKNVEEALNAYQKASAFIEDTPELLLRTASLHLAAERPDKALEALDSGTPSGPFFLQASLRFSDAGYYKEAEQLLDKAEKNGVPAGETALLRSLFRMEISENPQDALAPLESVEPDSPLYWSALQQKSRIYLRAENYNKALAVAREAREKFPEHKELWGMEAYVLARMSKVDDAEKLLQESLKQYPGDEDLLFSLGTVQHEQGREAEAMKTMEQIITINPRNYQALNYVGYTLADNNVELKRAMTLITAALEQNPDADFIVDSLAWVQYRLGMFEEAWKSINRCLVLGGDEAAIWEHYGDIALALGKKDEAVKGYTQSILRKPGNIDAVRKKLTRLKK